MAEGSDKDPLLDSQRPDFSEEPYPEIRNLSEPPKPKKETTFEYLKRKYEAFSNNPIVKFLKLLKDLKDKYQNLTKLLVASGVVVVVVVAVINAGDVGFSDATVATESQVCSQIGVEIIKTDGNAVDAAIATSFCLGVVHPMSAGIGGGGIMMVLNGTGTKPKVIDFRGLAPKGITEANFRGADALNRTTGIDAAVVPAQVRGLYAAWTLYGSVPWSVLVKPAIRLAREGFRVSDLLEKAIASNVDRIRSSTNDELKDFFIPHGQPLRRNQYVTRPKLAATLEVIATNPMEWESQSFLLDLRLVNGVKLMIADTPDARLQVMVRDALEVPFLDTTVFVPPPVSAGGPLLIEYLNVLNSFGKEKLGKNQDALHVHIEATKLAYANKARLGDPLPKFNSNQQDIVAEIVSLETAQNFLTNKLNLAHTLEPADYGYTHSEVTSSGGVSTVIVDPDEMIVSMSESLGDPFGSLELLPNSGILLNNHMRDFTLLENPDTPNPNSIAELKRAMTWLTPVITTVKGIPAIGMSASGGEKIVSALGQVLAAMLVNGMSPKLATEEPRFHYSPIDNKVHLEKGFKQLYREELKKRGHKIHELDGKDTGTAVQVVLLQGGQYYPAADTRKNPELPAGF